jgi:hypothetical protein
MPAQRNTSQLPILTSQGALPAGRGRVGFLEIELGFSELLKNRNIRLSHAIPPLDELKQRAYCKWYNLFCHATNGCNVFRRQVQSAINEG